MWTWPALQIVSCPSQSNNAAAEWTSRATWMHTRHAIALLEHDVRVTEGPRGIALADLAVVDDVGGPVRQEVGRVPA
jgi:hypothetical protein